MESFDQLVGKFREAIRDRGTEVRALMQDDVFRAEQTYGGQHSEMKANLMLAFRHLEDARMRLGKVLQAYHGGVSKYDKKPE